MKQQIFQIKKVVFTYLNSLIIFLHLDFNYKSRYFWKNRGKADLLDVQADGYERGYKVLAPLLQRMKRDVADFFVPLKKGSKVLDYGCGSGRYLEVFHGRFNLTGVDLSPTMLTKHTSKKFKDVELVCADFTKPNQYITKNMGKFDGIYSITVMEYILPKQLLKLFQNFNLLLKRGRSVYLLFPPAMSKWDRVSDLNYIRYYPPEVEKVLRMAGFKITGSYVFGTSRQIYAINKTGFPNDGYVITASKA